MRGMLDATPGNVCLVGLVRRAAIVTRVRHEVASRTRPGSLASLAAETVIVR